MKKKAQLLSVLVLFISAGLSAQVPQGINYQAVARDGNGTALANYTLTAVEFTILDGNNVKYTEVQNNVKTNSFGLFTLVVGKKNTGGTFPSVPWSTMTDPKIQVKINPDGSGLIDLGTSDFKTVPYAFFAGNGGGTSGINSLISIKPISSSGVCPSGGNWIYSGLDNNSNNLLDNSEITDTAMVCNGTDGSGIGTVTSVTGGTGLAGGVITGTGTLSLAPAGTPGTYLKVTTDAFGRVISGDSLRPSDIPNLDASKITSGIVPLSLGGTGSSVTSGATGSLVHLSGTKYAFLSQGNAGEFLQSNGANNAPSWEVPSVGTGGSVTASNGLTVVAGSDVQLGGSLNSNTSINTGNFNFTFSGNTSTAANPQFQSISNGTVAAIYGKNNFGGNGIGIFAESVGSGTAFKAVNLGTGPSALFMGGNVGIGTISPNSKLEISGTSAANNPLVLATQNGTAAALQGNNTSTSFTLGYGVEGLAAGTGAGVFGLNNSATGSGVGVLAQSENGTAFLSQVNNPAPNRYSGIFWGGDVGIGTQTPNATLDVNGTIATGAFRMTTAAGTNNILVSDAVGNARWQASNINTAFSATLTANPATVAGTPLTIPFDSKEFDSGLNFSITTFEYTVPSTGIYHFDAAVSWGFIVTGTTQITISIYKNPGAIILKTLTYYAPTAGGNFNNFGFVTSISSDLKLSMNDKIGVQVLSSAAQTISKQGTWFNGHKVY